MVKKSFLDTAIRLSNYEGFHNLTRSRKQGVI